MHIPIFCSEQFEMQIAGHQVKMVAGETWLGQFELPHRLSNQRGGTERVHLIVDIWPRQPHSGPGKVAKADWSLFCATTFGEALAAAHQRLFAHPDQAQHLTDCLDAFQKYRWSGGAATFTPEDVAGVEGRYYLRDDENHEGERPGQAPHVVGDIRTVQPDMEHEMQGLFGEEDNEDFEGAVWNGTEWADP
jgi:hypothetical protein